MLKSKISTSLAVFFGVLVMIFSLSYLVLAWKEPTDTPPKENVSLPVNVSDATQFKTGTFGVGGVFSADGGSGTTTLLVTEEFVGIGASNPADPYSPLTVYRNSKSTSFRTDKNSNVASFLRRYTDLPSGSNEETALSIYIYPKGPTSYLDRTVMLYAPTEGSMARVIQFSNASHSTYKPNPIIRFNVGETWNLPNTEKLVIELDKVKIGNPSHAVDLDVYGIITPLSDSRMKEDVKSLGSVLGKIGNINPVTYYWRQGGPQELIYPEGRQIGLIAQEVEKEFPELVSTDDNGYKFMNYDNFTAVLLQAIKEQQKEIEELKMEIDELKSN